MRNEEISQKECYLNSVSRTVKFFFIFEIKNLFISAVHDNEFILHCNKHKYIYIYRANNKEIMFYIRILKSSFL